MSLYHDIMYCTKGVRGRKLPRVSEDKGYQGCQSLKGAKGVRRQKVPRVKSSEGLLGGRVFSRSHLRSSLTPEEGTSCSYSYSHNFSDLTFHKPDCKQLILVVPNPRGENDLSDEQVEQLPSKVHQQRQKKDVRQSDTVFRKF